MLSFFLIVERATQSVHIATSLLPPANMSAFTTGKPLSDSIRPLNLCSETAKPLLAHRSRVQSLYRRYLKNELNWCIRRDVWRQRALEVRAEFESNRQVEVSKLSSFILMVNLLEFSCLLRNVKDPRQLAVLLEKAEAHLSIVKHPDPVIREDGNTSSAFLAVSNNCFVFVFSCYQS